MTRRRTPETSKTGIGIFDEVLARRKAELWKMMNHHVFDEVLEGEAVRMDLIRAK